MFATRIQRFLYRRIAKPVFFSRDPEEVHDAMTALGAALGSSRGIRSILRSLLSYASPSLRQTILGIEFPNPVGLSAGFDKDALLVDVLPSVGFGFEEVGSVTGERCAGNPKPRLWRLPKSKGLVVWYGLKNDGSETVSARLRGRTFEIPIGTSVARTNDATTVETEAGIRDYEKAFRAFADIGDYATVNVSCPNTCGGEPFATPERLDALLSRLDAIATRKPTFLKLPADISTDALDALVAVCDRHRVHGLILSNLTKKRDRATIDPTEIAVTDKGGVSGKPVFDPSNELISHLWKTTGRRYVIVGTGGIFSAEDAYEKIVRGASLVQLITGMIFEGPQLIGEINRGIARLLARDGFATVAEAVGTKNSRKDPAAG
ncbi:MAG: quinone-dependent dihydroorotate dehydrogenase [Candidatus Uhrbacteria bacterium]